MLRRNDMDRFDVCIAGAGVVGLAIAYRLSNSPKYKNASIVLIEKEESFGQITSSRNSEVIHAGIYYATDSLKAKLCVTGKDLLYAHLQEFQLPYKRLGKLIVAQKNEEEGLNAVKEKAIENGVNDLVWLDQQQLRKLEPMVKGSAALLSPSTGIIDSHSYMQNLLHLAEINGVTFASHTEIDSVSLGQDSFTVNSVLLHDRKLEAYKFSCTEFINCTGLEAQNLAGKTEGMNSACVPTLHLCKGDYFSHSGASPFNHLIYPMPEPNHTGLGIHSTLDIAGQLRFGPDTRYVDGQDYSIDASKSELFAASISRYYPGIDPQKLQPAYSGIRPKIVGPGEAAGDFQIQDSSVHGIEGLIQLFGMESPALTASLAIADHIASLMDL
jgi:L-2-hydroxyglutarate oxidase LhgO